MELLKDLGTPLDIVDGNGRTLIEVAGLNGQLQCAKKLSSWKAEFGLEYVGNDGIPPLSRYAAKGQEETVKVLAACTCSLLAARRSGGNI